MSDILNKMLSAEWDYTQKENKQLRCKRHNRTGLIACQFCSISMYNQKDGFTCEPTT